MKTKILALFVATAGFASAAMTIEQTHTVPPYVAGSSQVFTFDRFDTQGGTRTLTGVTVYFSFDKTGGSLEVDNDSATGGLATLTHELRGQLYSASVSVGTAANYVSATSQFNTILGGNDGDSTGVQSGGSDYYLYNAPDVLGTSHTASISSGSWSAYQGAGTYDIYFISTQLYGTSGVGGLATTQIPSDITPTVTVTYTYVPEPSAALIGGLGFLCLLRRRR